MIRRRQRQLARDRMITAELIELRYLIQQANSAHAKERDELHKEVKSLWAVLHSRTDQLA